MLPINISFVLDLPGYYVAYGLSSFLLTLGIPLVCPVKGWNMSVGTEEQRVGKRRGSRSIRRFFLPLCFVLFGCLLCFVVPFIRFFSPAQGRFGLSLSFSSACSPLSFLPIPYLPLLVSLSFLCVYTTRKGEKQGHGESPLICMFLKRFLFLSMCLSVQGGKRWRDKTKNNKLWAYVCTWCWCTFFVRFLLPPRQPDRERKDAQVTSIISLFIPHFTATTIIQKKMRDEEEGMEIQRWRCGIPLMMMATKNDSKSHQNNSRSRKKRRPGLLPTLFKLGD